MTENLHHHTAAILLARAAAWRTSVEGHENGREQAAGIWWNAAIGADDQVKSFSEWLALLVSPQLIDIEAWFHFWLLEIEVGAVPAHRIQLLTGYFQEEFKVDAGNPGDMLHAGYAVITDYFVTADENFHAILSRIASLPESTVAKLVLTGLQMTWFLPYGQLCTFAK